MAFTLTVLVIDANLNPVPNTLVMFGGAQGTTDGAGRWSTTVANLPVIPQIRVDHPAYVTERITFTGDPHTETWDNPLAHREVTGNDVTVTVVVGRMDTSPVTSLSDIDVKRIMATRNRDPKAARTMPWPSNPKIHTYFGHWNNALTFRQANRELLKPTASAGRNPPSKGSKPFSKTSSVARVFAILVLAALRAVASSRSTSPTDLPWYSGGSPSWTG